MATGDLVTGAGAQYEFRNVLFGTQSAPEGRPRIVVEKVEGLDSTPDIRTADIERKDTHGDFSGVDLMAPRVVEMDVDILNNSHSGSMASSRALSKAMSPARSGAPEMFVFQRPGETKRFVWAKPRRKSIPSNYELARGLGKGTLQWYCPDPRIYKFAETTTDITIASGATSASGTVTNGGDFETWPILELLGVGTNPRIKNNTLNRTVRFDLQMTASTDLLVLDFGRKTATLNGAEAFQFKRGDNQWWDLLAGGNSITVTRTGTTGTLRARFRHRDAWV